jgi:hypothetical protein
MDPVLRAREQRQLALAQRAATQQTNAVMAQRYDRRLQRARTRSTTGAYVAASAAGLGTLDAVTAVAAGSGIVPGAPGLWLVAAAVAGFASVRARATLRDAQPPAPLPLPPLPPPVLPPGAVGAQEALDLARAEAQLYAMVPAVDHLHLGAGDTLRETLAAVQPRMHSLLERLELVSGIDAVRAPQAAEAAETLRRRLVAGIRAYNDLIAATATLLAAPEPAGPASDHLAAAARDLEAYAAGLAAASDVFDGR